MSHCTIPNPIDSLHLTSTNPKKMMSKDEIEAEKKFIKQEKDKIFNPNPERECRKEFYQELKETHPELAMAFPELPHKKKKY